MTTTENPALDDGAVPGLMHRVEYAAVRALAALFGLLPRRAGLWAAELLARLFYRVVAGRRRVSLANLEAVFPDSSEAWRRKTAEASFASFARMIADVFHLARREDASLFRYREEEVERVRGLFARGKGVIFVYFHYGNWEALGVSYSFLGLPPTHPVAQRFNNPLITEYVRRLREKDGVRILFRRDAGREVLRALKRGEGVGIPCDVNASPRDGIFVDFMGLPTLTVPAPARLSLRFGSPVVISYARMLPDRTYEVRFGPVLEPEGRSDAAAFMEEINRAIEAVVRADPSQYMWGHKRWKTAPPDADLSRYPYYAGRISPGGGAR